MAEIGSNFKKVKRGKIAKTYTDELPRLKKCVESACDYFKDNVNRYHKSRNFIFNTSLTTQDIAALEELDMRPLEFNVLEAYVSRLKGEWSKQTPSFRFHSTSTFSTNAAMITFLKGHFQAIIDDANKQGFSDTIYSETLSGGYSVMEVVTEYEGPRSFDQELRLRKVYDPTLTYFDPMARLPSKSDARYAGRLFPMKLSEFQDQYPDVDVSNLKFSQSSECFNWSYRDGQEDIILIADHYEKQIKRKKIFLLADGKTYDKGEYEALLAQYDDPNVLVPPPSVVKSRISEFEAVVRYRFVGNTMIEYEQTIFDSLPLIFVDGNSAILSKSDTSGSAGAQCSYQMTRSYFHHAMDTQRLKNYAGQKLAAELEGMIMHKFMADIESIPNKYIDAWIRPQKASTLIYESRNKNGDPLPQPSAVARAPIPPEIVSTYMSADQTIQGILGSYDASLGIQNNQLSGVAIVEGATQSNAAAMPFVMNYLAALQQAATVMLEVMPKIYQTPRTLPCINKDGQRAYFNINNPNDPTSYLDFGGSDLGVSVTAGPNYQIQKNKALDTVIRLMNAVPAFANMINSQPGGMSVIIDNLDIKGADNLKEMAAQFQQQQAAQQQAAQNQPPPIDPMVQLKAQEAQNKNQIQNRELDLKEGIAQADIQMKMQKHAAELQKQLFDEDIQSGQLQINAMQAASSAKQNQRDYLVQLAEMEASREHESSALIGKQIEQQTALIQGISKQPRSYHENRNT